MTISIKPTASGSTIEQDGSTILTVDGSGNITPSNSMYPKVPAFRGSISANQSISNNSWTKVQIDDLIIDTTNGMFDDTTNYRFTPTVAGYYLFSFAVHVGSVQSGKNVATRVYKNGNQAGYGINSSPSFTSNHTSGHTILHHANGSTDYFELYAYQNNDSTETIFRGTYVDVTWFQAHLVSV